ncbi:hypothetical protein BMS3Bbin05_01163 [bacterium BMS3Bbin05]|nr:hypothetical protein BMS3Bbin05_01163 [bacterium BMS3Bbin05]HDH06584.1 hypothetical protein [Nitrospirota bacterium]
MNYLIDTDILIEWLRGKKTVVRFFQETKGILYYSSITRKELLVGCNNISEKERILNLLRTMRDVAHDAVAAIKEKEKPIKMFQKAIREN